MTYSFDWTSDPATLELLVALPDDAVELVVSATDEFGRETTARWSPRVN